MHTCQKDDLQALQYKTQATQAQLEAQQEAEARKRIEAEARAVAQARMPANPAVSSVTCFKIWYRCPDWWFRVVTALECSLILVLSHAT